MSDINTVTVTGRLTKDPEKVQTTSGVELARTGIAVSHYRKDQDDEVSFFDLTIFGTFSDLVVKKARRGDTVVVQGRLNQSRWQTTEGENRSKVAIIVNQMQGEFIYRQADGSDTPARSDTPAPAQTTIDPAQPPVAAPAGTVSQDDDIPF